MQIHSDHRIRDMVKQPIDIHPHRPLDTRPKTFTHQRNDIQTKIGILRANIRLKVRMALRIHIQQTINTASLLMALIRMKIPIQRLSQLIQVNRIRVQAIQQPIKIVSTFITTFIPPTPIQCCTNTIIRCRTTKIDIPTSMPRMFRPY